MRMIHTYLSVLRQATWTFIRKYKFTEEAPGCHLVSEHSEEQWIAQKCRRPSPSQAPTRSFPWHLCGALPTSMLHRRWNRCWPREQCSRMQPPSCSPIPCRYVHHDVRAQWSYAPSRFSLNHQQSYSLSDRILNPNCDRENLQYCYMKRNRQPLKSWFSYDHVMLYALSDRYQNHQASSKHLSIFLRSQLRRNASSCNKWKEKFASETRSSYRRKHSLLDTI